LEIWPSKISHLPVQKGRFLFILDSNVPNILEIRFNFESTLIIVSAPQVMRVFSGSALRVQERKAGALPLHPPEH
jgi:hypothetical protein